LNYPNFSCESYQHIADENVDKFYLDFQFICFNFTAEKEAELNLIFIL